MIPTLAALAAGSTAALIWMALAVRRDWSDRALQAWPVVFVPTYVAVGLAVMAVQS